VDQRPEPFTNSESKRNKSGKRKGEGSRENAQHKIQPWDTTGGTENMRLRQQQKKVKKRK